MKAWLVENTRDYDYFFWNEIIFAENYKEARKLAMRTDLYEGSEDFIYLRVRRYPDMDDTENLNHKDYTYKLWLSGWMWTEAKYPLDPYDNYSDKREARIDFLEWYSKYYRESENNEID